MLGAAEQCLKRGFAIGIGARSPPSERAAGSQEASQKISGGASSGSSGRVRGTRTRTRSCFGTLSAGVPGSLVGVCNDVRNQALRILVS
jgi:hypothetical protein